MEKEQNEIDVSEDFFGLFWDYVKDDNITDIEYDGQFIWYTDSNGAIRKSGKEVKDSDIELFTSKVANRANKLFNRKETILEADTDTLRISILHEEIAKSGRSICIRKTPPAVRIIPEEAVKNGYCTQEMLSFLINCVKARKTFVICGEPGAGKTECAKMLSTYIAEDEKVITIEDSPEWRYKKINPGKMGVEIVVNEGFDYTQAIKASLRQNPKWLMLAEARSVEVKSLIECWSTGVSGFTTLHTNDVRNIPDRILDMMPTRIDADRLENDVYRYVDVGILISKKMIDGERKRRIEQICYFVRDKKKNFILPVALDGRMALTGYNMEMICSQFDPDVVPEVFPGIDIPGGDFGSALMVTDLNRRL